MVQISVPCVLYSYYYFVNATFITCNHRYSNAVQYAMRLNYAPPKGTNTTSNHSHRPLECLKTVPVGRGCVAARLEIGSG